MMRLLNRLLVFGLGVILAAAGFVIAVEATWTGLGYRLLGFPGKSWLHALRSAAWSDRSVMVGAAIAAAVGLLLLVAELRRQPKRLARSSIEDQDTWLIQRRSAEQHVGRVVQQEVPRSPVKAGLTISRRRWTLRLRAPAAESTKPDLEAAGQRELENLGAPAGSKVLVRTTRPPRVS
jgi:hypothetical protein